MTITPWSPRADGARAPGRRTVLAAIALLAVGACRIERPAPADTTTPWTDAASRPLPVDTPSVTVVTLPLPPDTLAGLALDTFVPAAPLPTPRVTVPPVSVPGATPSARSAAASGDTAALTATPAELAELRAGMAVPVAGVRAADLRDGYAEARGSRVHEALDIRAPRGTPVLAAIDGRVTKLHSSVPGGLMVYAADPSDRFVMMYGHLDRYADGVVEGMPLRRGQLLGYVGTTGNAPPGTPHLHFAVARGRPSVKWWKGTAVNPYPLLAP